MNLARLLSACVVGVAMTSTSLAATFETPYEEQIQYALENLVSGTSTESKVRGANLFVKPVRTWKSVSGHWCRRYEVRITEPEGEPFEGEQTRCRETTGTWKPVADN